MTEPLFKTHGAPNWADCATTDLAGAEAFYGKVFGWTGEHVTASNGETYAVQRLDGKMVAGIFPLNAELRAMNVPPHWSTYIEVADLDAALDRLRDKGGQVIEGPFEEPEVGRMAIVQDAVGAFLRLWQSAPGHSGEVFNVPGAMTWNELNTREPDKAAAFYAAVLGVEVEEMEVGPRVYRVLKADGRPVAGILEHTPEMGEGPDTWDVYFASDNVDATAEAVVAAGGKVLAEPFDLPVGGRMAVLQDPQGAVFEVMRMEGSEG